MEMPNTKPPTTSLEAWEWKMQRAAETSWANYSFFFGGSNNNADEIQRIDARRTPGLKLFLGSSTGNMLVDDKKTLERIFSETDLIIATHCEKEEIIRANRNDLPLTEKKITAEVCVHHLIFSDADYDRLGNRIKWNPAVKTLRDREALRAAVRSGLVDIVATDHAPHLLSEKEGNCLTAASGGPLTQYALISMLDMAREGVFTKELVVEKTAHRPAELFAIEKRGYLREGYYADLVLIDPEGKTPVKTKSIISLCGWSPFEGHTFGHRVEATYINGDCAYRAGALSEVRPSVAPLLYSHP